MGRTLILEKYLENKISKLQANKERKVITGLILGQHTEAKDFAVSFVKCPDQVDNDGEIETASKVGESGSDASINPTEKKKSVKHDKEIFDKKWISEHGRQVNRMLTGGTSIIGIFIYCDTDFASKNQTTISQCLFNLQSKIDRNKWLRKAAIHNDRFMFHICSMTQKITCRSLNLNDQKQAVFKPAEFRFQSFLTSWHQVNTTIDVHINIYVPIMKKFSDIEDAILQACQYEIAQIWNSYTSEGFKIINDDQLIANQSSGKSKKKQQDTGKELRLTLFKIPYASNVEEVIAYNPVNLEVKFFGAIQARATVNDKATYGDAVNAIKTDIIRSMLTRIELLCEEAEVNNLDHSAEWSLVSPMRVFLPFEKSGLYFCDYSFKDESAGDIISRFSELLDMTPLTNELVYAERSPDVSEASMLFHSGEVAIDQQSDIASEISNSLLEETKDKKFVYFLIALLIILIGIGIHLVFN